MTIRSTRTRRLVALAASSVLIAAACGNDDSSSATTAAPTTAPGGGDASGRCGDASRLGSTLNFLNWADYIDTAVLDRFEQECGVKVTMDLHTANEEAVAKIQVGNSGYSLVIVTDYAVDIMASQGLLAALDLSAIPNAANLDPDQMDPYYDPGNKYSLPYQYSTTGMAYDTTVFDTAPTSWDALFAGNTQCGRSSLLADQRETIGSALVYKGHEWNSTDPAAHDEALDVLLAARDCVSGFDSANYIGNLASGEVVLAASWGFAAGIAYVDNPNIRYVIPQEGGIIWQDNFVIPADAPDAYTAHVFINYMLEADIGALITEFTFGYTPNLSVVPLLSDDYEAVIAGAGLELTDEVRSRLVYQVRGPEHSIFADTWDAVVAAG
jgi:spermidine/putrescine transport system substrate-binding protein